MVKTDSIILELQELAADSNIDVSDLLRKCLIIATKLRLEDFKMWIQHEWTAMTDLSQMCQTIVIFVGK